MIQNAFNNYNFEKKNGQEEVTKNGQEVRKQKEILVQFLQKVLQAQKKDTLYLYFSDFVKDLRNASFFVLPTINKIPKGVKFETQEDKERANKRKVENEAALVIPEWLAVVDIDDVEVFTTTFQVSREEIEKIATIKTGRGYHVYIWDPEGKIPHRSKKDGWEVKGRHNALVMLPGSRIFHEELKRNVTYEVLNPHIWEWEELPEWLKGILERFMQEKSQPDDEPIEVVEPILEDDEKDEEKYQVEVDWQRLKELILSHWQKGNRQNLTIWVAGLLTKNGVPEEKIKEFLEEIIMETGGHEKKQRIKGIERTIEKAKKQMKVKGYSGLVEIGIPQEELERCIVKKVKKVHLRPKDYPHFGSKMYKEKDGLLYKKKSEGGWSQLGPAILIRSKIVGNDKITYEIEYEGRTFTLEKISDIKCIEEKTGIAVTYEKGFKEWLNIYIRTQKLPIKLMCSQTGWHKIDGKWVFLHPARQPHYVWEEHILVKRRLTGKKNTEVLHNLVRESLENPCFLTLCFLASYTSVILSMLPPAESQPFVVLLTGMSHKGKTKTAVVACNLWYNAAASRFSIFATPTGLERLQFQLKDLPITPDELSVSSTEPEKIIFQISTGVTKVRSNKKLTVNIDDLSNVIFLNSELAEETYLKRAGALRRMITIPFIIEEVENWEKKIDKALYSYGAGLDFLDWLEQKKIEDLMDEKTTEVFNDLIEKEELRPYFRIAKPLLITTMLVGNYYQLDTQKQEKLLNFVVDFLKQQSEAFYEKIDIVERFMEDLLQWITQNVFSFEGLAPEGKLTRPVLGKVKEDKVYIPTKIFNSFCQEKGYHAKELLKELSKRNMLFKRDPTAYCFSERIVGVSIHCYCIIPPKGSLPDII